MAKEDQIAYNKLLSLIDNTNIIQIDKKFGGYEITIFSKIDKEKHSHYNGKSLLEALLKIK